MSELAKPWLWPATKRDDAVFGVRLGRLLHWSFVAFAACILLVGFAFTALSYPEHRAALVDGLAWDRAHHLPDQTGNVKVAVITAAGEKIPPTPDSFGIDLQPGDEMRPDEVPIRPNGALLGMAVALSLALVGRGARYLVGNE